ncbi:MAG: trimethylamine methyltransferase family protein [Bacteroidota bacterium]|nr:trimethylamine methyltransferase family protein [Bacteroidota bacterium]
MHVRPKLQLLGPEQINMVHQSSIRILEETGIKVESKKALQIFAKSDGLIIKDGVVYLKGELINHAIKQAPSCIEVFRKTGDHAFHLGKNQGHETHFGIGVTNTWFQDIGSNQVELFTRKHMQHSVKLGDLLDNFNMVSTIGIPSDASVDKVDLYSSLDMYANTAKPLVLLVSGDGKINDVFDMLCSLHGDISSKPFCIPYVNPITPLVLNEATTDKMIATINMDLPLMYSNYSMYGGTTPVAEGDSLALLNAELLAGLVFGQLVKEGSKMILGSLPAAFNMATMGSHYTPTSYLLNLACAEMMSFYEIPHCGTSGSNNGRGADLLAAGNLWLNHLSSCMGKIGCAPFVGGNFDSMAFSPTMVILSNQIIGEARKFARGFAFNNETININEINRVGHGGDYLTSEQTLASLDELSNTDSMWSSLSLEAWKEQQMPTAEKELTAHTLDLYARAIKESEESLDTIKKGEEFIKRQASYEP